MQGNYADSLVYPLFSDGSHEAEEHQAGGEVPEGLAGQGGQQRQRQGGAYRLPQDPGGPRGGGEWDCDLSFTNIKLYNLEYFLLFYAGVVGNFNC